MVAVVTDFGADRFAGLALEDLVGALSPRVA